MPRRRLVSYVMPLVSYVALSFPNMTARSLSAAQQMLQAFCDSKCTKRLSLKDAIEILNEWPEAATVSLTDAHLSPEEACLPVEDSQQSPISQSKSTLLLHSALFNETHLKFIDALIAANTAALTNRPQLFHYVVYRSNRTDEETLELLQLLHKYCPRVISTPHEQGGSLPLHFACFRTNLQLPVLQWLVQTYPEAAKTPLPAATTSRATPLHALVYKRDIWLQPIRLLVNSCPEAVTVKNIKQALPLHEALKHPRTNVDVIRCLVEAWPESVYVKDNLRCLPIDWYIKQRDGQTLQEQMVTMLTPPGSNKLHFCCQYASLSKTIFSIGGTMDNPFVSLYNGKIPLHVALKRTDTYSYDIIQALLAHYPGTASLPTNKMEYPLHLAVRHCRNDETITQLARLYPAAVGIADCDGLPPLFQLGIQQSRKERQNSRLGALWELLIVWPQVIEAWRR